MANNFERMLDVVNEAFDTRNDPDQISVDEDQQKRLAAIHPNTLTEVANEDGPIVWILMIPTTSETMRKFILGDITEKQLLFETVPGEKYAAIYLCSASVLPEFRNKGLAKKATMEAITAIRKNHQISSLYYWPFSEEGKLLAQSVANEQGLPLSIPVKDIITADGTVVVVEAAITINGDLMPTLFIGKHEALLPGATLTSATGEQWLVKTREPMAKVAWFTKLAGQGIACFTLTGIGHQHRPVVGEVLTMLL